MNRRERRRGRMYLLPLLLGLTGIALLVLEWVLRIQGADGAAEDIAVLPQAFLQPAADEAALVLERVALGAGELRIFGSCFRRAARRTVLVFQPGPRFFLILIPAGCAPVTERNLDQGRHQSLTS